MSWLERRKAATRDAQQRVDSIVRLETETIRLRSELARVVSYSHELERALVGCASVATTVLERTKDWAPDPGTQFVREQMVELAARTGVEQ